MLRYFAPSDFKSKFPRTQVILDGTEAPVEKPLNPVSQRASFSSYKNKNTVTSVIGGTPGGLVSYNICFSSIWWIELQTGRLLNEVTFLKCVLQVIL